MKSLEELEDVFNETGRRINQRTEQYNEEQKEELTANITEIAKKLINNLQYFRMSDRVLGNIDDKFYELKDRLLKMNEGQTRKMAEDTVAELKSAIPDMQELLEQEEIEKDEKEYITNSKFDKIQNNAEDRKEGNKQDKDSIYIKECIQNSYTDIQRNVMNYLQVEGIVRMGLKANDVQDMNDIIVNSCKGCIRDMSERHDMHIDGIGQMIEEQVGELKLNVENVFAKQDNSVEKNESYSFEYYIKLSGADLESFNKNTSEIVEESQKPKEEDLSNDLEDIVIE